MNEPILVLERGGQLMVDLGALSLLATPPMPETFMLAPPEGEVLPLTTFERCLVWAARNGPETLDRVEARYRKLSASDPASFDRGYRPRDHIAAALRWDEIGPVTRELFRIYRVAIARAFAS